jgi:hypothetical protein
MTDPGESGLVVPVPTATPVVAPWRERLDPTAVHGVPAHVTVLYPFVPPQQVTSETVERLSSLFAGIARFDFVLRDVAWFDDEVVYLAPEPAAPLIALTRAVMVAFPAYPPYGGAFSEITPHLTIGDHGSRDELRRAATAVAPALPISARATDVWLMFASPGDQAWQVHARFPLGGRTAIEV